MKTTTRQNGWIFKPLPPIARFRAEWSAAARGSRHDAGTSPVLDDAAISILYDDTYHALNQPDMLTLEQATAYAAITPEAYRAEAAAGKRLLFSVGKACERVPAWELNICGYSDRFLHDLAREYVRCHKGPDAMLRFVTLMRSTVDVPLVLPESDLRAAFDDVRGPSLLAPSAPLTVPVPIPLTVLVLQRHKNLHYIPALLQAFSRQLEQGAVHENDGKPPFSESFIKTYGRALMPA